jgi:hypothetical protein
MKSVLLSAISQVIQFLKVHGESPCQGGFWEDSILTQDVLPTKLTGAQP